MFKVNTKSAEQYHSALTTSKNKIDNISYIDIKGTTYFSPTPQYIAETLNDINLCLPNTFKKKCGINNVTLNNKVCYGDNSKMYDTEFPDTWVN